MLDAYTSPPVEDRMSDLKVGVASGQTPNFKLVVPVDSNRLINRFCSGDYR